MIKESYDKVISEKNSLEKNNIDILEMNGALSNKVGELTNQLGALKDTIEQITEDEDQTKIKIKGMLENLS